MRDEVREEARRYLRQRIEAGEAVVLRTSAPRTARAAAAPRPVAIAPSPPPATVAAALPASDSLAKIAAEIAVCTRCPLHATRTRAVPGAGAEDADLVFVGEGPGADEDAQGLPFVGRAGQLLTKIIEAIQLTRAEVFITNIVKCRPPGNRDPEPGEIAACMPYLQRQLRVLEPKVICSLGRHSSATLTGRQASMASLRTSTHSYADVPVFPTYHPAALLRNPEWKRPVWEDIQKVRAAYDRARTNP